MQSSPRGRTKTKQIVQPQRRRDTIYRSALSLNTLFPKFTRKQVTYIVGALMTILACFPAMTNIGNIVQILGWAVVGIGAICIVEHFLFPKIGYTRFWSMYKEMKINWAAIISWAIGIAFVLVMLNTGLLHRNFIFIPQYIISGVCYIIFAGMMGARGDYSKEEAEEAKFQQELKELVDSDMEKQLLENENHVVKNAGLATTLSYIAYVLLASILVVSFMTFTGAMAIATFKSVAFGLTIGYFVLNGTATFIKFKNEASALQ